MPSSACVLASISSFARRFVVRSRVPDVSCYTWRSRRQCLLGKLVAGQAVTIFELKRGRVSEVVVGVVQHS